MKNKTLQSRTIKVEFAGDMYRRKTFPKIRLQGQWLEQFGFPPSGRVEVVQVAHGELRLKFVGDPSEACVLNELPLKHRAERQLPLL